MNVLVTGGAGFLVYRALITVQQGLSHTVQWLAAHEVVAVHA